MIVRCRFGGRGADPDDLRQTKPKTDLKLQLVTLAPFRQCQRKTQRVRVMRHRLLHREAAQVAIGGLLPVLDRFLVLRRTLELLRDTSGVVLTASGNRFSSTSAIAE